MEDWYWDVSDIKNSPSFKAGIDNLTETRYRTEGAKFISTIGQQLKLRYVTLATGTVYFHRFYMYHSFKEFHRYAIASACLFLAGKVEETPKKARDLFKQISLSGLITDQAMATVFGDDPKESLMTLERIILKTIKFDLQVDHPYKFMLKYAKSFIGDRARIEKVVQMGWTFINDSLCTTLCLQWEPEIIAISLMDLSCRISKYEITDWTGKPEGHKGKWWDQFVADVSMELLESICHQVLDFYSNAAPGQQAKSSSSSTSTSKAATAESNKRAASDGSSAPAQPASKVARTDPVVSQSQTVQPTATAPAPASQTATYPPVAPAPTYHQPPAYPPQSQPPPPGLPTSAPSLPPYGPPPPGYAPMYAAPPPQMSVTSAQAAPPGAYPPPPHPPPPHPAAHYYSQPPPTAPVHPSLYYSQAPRPGVPYQPGYPPPPHMPHYPQPAARRRESSLKVLTNNQ